MSDGSPVDPLAQIQIPGRRGRSAHELPFPHRTPACRTAPFEAFAGVGNPFSLGVLKPGEQVVDLGSGGGFDCFIASGQVGPEGYAFLAHKPK